MQQFRPRGRIRRVGLWRLACCFLASCGWLAPIAWGSERLGVRTLSFCERLAIESGGVLRTILGSFQKPLGASEIPEDLATAAASARFNAERQALLVRHFRLQPSIRVATYNGNRLRFRFLRNRMYEAAEPVIEAALYNYLVENRPIALALQEFWHERDHALLERLAHQAGYRLTLQDPGIQRASGMQILVRSDLSLARTDFFPFVRGAHPVRSRVEANFGVNRGLLIAEVVLPNGGRIRLGTTHLTPLSNGFEVREQQLAALVELRQEWAGVQAQAGLLLGDFNIAANFADGTASETRALAGLRGQYDRLHLELGVIDAFRSVHSQNVPGYTNIVEHPRPFMLSTPPAAKRIDYIFLTEGENSQVAVLDSRVLLSERMNSDGEPDPNGIFPSDHALLEAELQLIEKTP